MRRHSLGPHFFVTLLIAIQFACAGRADCPAKAFEGVIDFTTRVTGAKSNSAIGVNGYYRMQVTVDARCGVQVQVVKLGFNKTFFKREQLQWGTFTPRIYGVSSMSGEAMVLAVDASLGSERGRVLDIAVSLVKFDNGWQDTTGPGFWRHLGASWDEAGMWGGLEWAVSAADKPLASPMKPKCDVVVSGQGQGSIPAFQCNGLVIANNNLSTAIYAAATQAPGAEPSFDKIAGAGIFAQGGRWWDVCVHSESDNPGNPGPMASRLVWLNSNGVEHSEMDADAGAWKRCGARKPKPERPAVPRWQGGIE